jgi:hypothetical protein
MIQKQKEIAEAEARQNQPKQVLHTASCCSPYIPEYVGYQQPTASTAQLPPPPPMAPTLIHISSQKGIAKRSNNTTHEKSPKLTQSTLCPNRDIFTKAIQGLDQKVFKFNVFFTFMSLYFPSEDNIRRFNLRSVVINLWLHHRV